MFNSFVFNSAFFNLFLPHLLRFADRPDINSINGEIIRVDIQRKSVEPFSPNVNDPAVLVDDPNTLVGAPLGEIIFGLFGID